MCSAGPKIQCQQKSRDTEQGAFRYTVSIKELLISSYRGKPINKVKTQFLSHLHFDDSDKLIPSEQDCGGSFPGKLAQYQRNKPEDIHTMCLNLFSLV